MLRALFAASLSLAAASPDQQPPPLEFGSDVRMIRLDVSVVADSGLPVAGLLPEDFRVEEDGEPVEITLFQAFSADDPAGGFVMADGTEVPEAPPRRVILLLDAGLMHMRELIRARESAERFLRLQTTEGDWVRVINLRSGRAWTGAIPEDRNTLISAVRSIGWRTEAAWGPAAGSPVDPIVEEFATDGGELGASAAIQNEVFLSQFAQTSGLFGMLEAILLQLGGVDGRKAVVLISPGFPQIRHLERRLQQVATLAREAATAVYYVDSRGLDGLVPSPGAPMRPAFELAWERSAGAQDLAAATGGFTSRFSNSLERALGRVAAEMRTYYVIGYRPPRPFDGRFHEVEIDVAVDGLKARTKKGYLATARR